MEYQDTIYGSVQFDEPVLLDLIQSAALTRLRGVLQHGISGLIGITTPITRFEHSVGAMLLVRRLGAGLEEQIAALLHDVSHTAFSHVIDYVVQGHDSQSYHEEKKEEFLMNSDIPVVLGQHGYDWRDFLHETAYPLLEQPSPRLCADRLDYFLRDALPLGLATLADIHGVLEHLVVKNGRIVTNNLPVAQWLGYTFIAADDASWANFREVGLYELTAQAIQMALQRGLITEVDFWGVDKQLWHTLQTTPDADLQAHLRLISPHTRFVWDAVAPTFTVSTKLRAIDPDVVIDEHCLPLSAIDPAFAKYRQEYLAKKQGKWPMRVIASI